MLFRLLPDVKGKHMSSRLFSALEQLDQSLQDVQVQVDWLHAGLEVGDDDLQASLADAHQKAVAIRDLVRAERPNANWSDRTALERLLHDLEREAQVRLTEQRRARLLDLAEELNAGTVRHRFESRASSLNSLRVDAIRELRVAAALPDQQKELPGPAAAEWLHWACNLLEESDSDVFEDLRRDFPALETFAVEMEESYWSPGEGGRETFSAPQPETPQRPPDPSPGWQDWQSSSSSAPNAAADFRKPPHNVRVPADAVVKTGGGYTAAAVALGYEAQASAAPSLAETHWEVENMPWQQAKAMEEEEVDVQPIAPPPPMKVCDKCGMGYSNGFHTCTAEYLTHDEPPMPATMTPSAYPSNGKNGSGGNGSASATDLQLHSILEADEERFEAPAAAGSTEEEVQDSSREIAEHEFKRLKAIVEQRYAEEAEKESAKKEETLFLNLTSKQVMIYGSAVAVILVAVILLVVHHFNAKSAEAAAAVATVKTPVVLPDPDMQKEITQRLSGLKDSTIDVTVQSGVVTLTGKSPSEEEAIQAEDLAMQTTGVKVVRDRLQVDSKSGSNSKPHAGKTSQH